MNTTYQQRLTIALALSLLLHVAAMWFYASAEITRVLARLLASPAAVRVTAVPVLPPPAHRRVPQLSFVEVDNQQATLTKPKDAKFFSDRSSLAANPTPQKSSADIPKIEGRKRNNLETSTVRTPGRSQPPPSEKAQPKPVREPHLTAKLTPPIPQPAEGITAPQLLPKLPPTPPAETTPQPRLTEPQFAMRPEPRTGEDSQREIPTLASRTEAGVDRKGPVALNVVGMPQGAYSKKMFASIGRRWTLLLEKYYADGEPGRVKLNFTLYPDGHVAKLKIALNTATGILASYCQKAVLDAAPFDPWPEELKLLGGDHLDISIEFNVYVN